MQWQRLARPGEIAGIQRSLFVGVGTFGKRVCSELLEWFRLLDSLYGHHGTRIIDLVHFVQILDPDTREVAYPLQNMMVVDTGDVRAPRSLATRAEMYDRFRTSANSIHELIRREVEQVSRDSLRPSSERDFVHVYIVASLCEVEGSIGFWPLGCLCRKLIETVGFQQIILTGICSAASFSGSASYYWEQANAYVALREAQAISQGEWNPWGESPLFAQESGSPFDWLYAFTREKQSNLRPGCLADLTQTISILLETLVLTSATRHIDQALLDDFRGSNAICVSTCGASAAVIPIRELHDFNSKRLAGEIVRDSVLKLTEESLDTVAELISQLTAQRQLLSVESVRTAICCDLQLEYRSRPSPGTYWPSEIAADPIQNYAQAPFSQWTQLVETYDHTLEYWKTSILDQRTRDNLAVVVNDRCHRIRSHVAHLSEATNDGLLAALAFLKEIQKATEDRLESPNLVESGIASASNAERDQRTLIEMIRNRPSILGTVLRFSLLGVLILQVLIAFYPTWRDYIPKILRVPLVTLLAAELLPWVGAITFLLVERWLRRRQFRRTLDQYTLLHKWRLDREVNARVRDAYERVLDWTGQSVARLENVVDYLKRRSQQYIAIQLQDIVPKSFVVFPVADLAGCQELYADIIPDSRRLALMNCLSSLNFQAMLEHALGSEQSRAGEMVIEAARQFAFSQLPHPRIQKVEHFVPVDAIDDLTNHMWNCAVPWARATSEDSYDESRTSLSIASSALNGDQSKIISTLCRDFDSFGLTTVDPYVISLVRQDHGLGLGALRCWGDLERSYQMLGSDTQYLYIDSEWTNVNLPTPFPDDSEARSDFRFLWHLWDEIPLEDISEADGAETGDFFLSAQVSVEPDETPAFVIEETRVETRLKPQKPKPVEESEIQAVLLPVRLISPPQPQGQVAPLSDESVQSATVPVDKLDKSTSGTVTDTTEPHEGETDGRPAVENDEAQAGSVKGGPVSEAQTAETKTEPAFRASPPEETSDLPQEEEKGIWHGLLEWLRKLTI